MIHERQETIPIRLIVMRDIDRCIIIIPALNVEIWAADEAKARDLAFKFITDKEEGRNESVGHRVVSILN